MKVKNKKGIKLITTIFSLVLVTSIFSSCSDEPKGPETKRLKSSTTLVYAVASNSLSPNFVQDTTEMIVAAPYLDLQNNEVLIYATTYHQEKQQLLRLTKKGNTHHFQVVKEFENNISSLNPERVAEVLDYVANKYEAESYGLLFWSHSTGSQPFFDPNTKGETGNSTRAENNGSSLETEDYPMAFSFGQDINSALGLNLQINIDALAEVIPDHFFEYIWFDSCYMSNIESIYQFRNKCKYYVGYPTEVLEYGLPYDLVLPYIAKKNPELIKGAETFFNYYANNPYSGLRSATVAVTDMSKIEELASFCNQQIIDYIKPSPLRFVRYTRGSTGPFYDLGDYMEEIARSAGLFVEDEEKSEEATSDDGEVEVLTKEEEWRLEWNYILNQAVVYKAATPYFLSLEMPAERYTGLSAHIYDLDSSSETEKYYRSYDWFKRVFYLSGF